MKEAKKRGGGFKTNMVNILTEIPKDVTNMKNTQF